MSYGVSSRTLRDLKHLDAASISRVPRSLLIELTKLDQGLPPIPQSVAGVASSSLTEQPSEAVDKTIADYIGRTTIIEAMDDPEIFGGHFKPGEDWSAWRMFLKALFALPMNNAELVIFRELTDRDTPPAKPCKEATLICGRRGGKSRILALIAAFLACFVDHAPYLSVGEVATIPIVASDKMQARSVMRYIMGFLENTPVLAPLIKNPKIAHTWGVELTNRVVIEVSVAKFSAVRSYTVVAFIGDEIAFWPAEDSANPDVEIISAVQPGMLTIPHAILLKSSSPYAKKGVLYNDFVKHFGRDDASVLVVKGSTLQMHPNVNTERIDQIRQDDPERASAEYDANFRSDVSQFVDREVVDACVLRGVHEIEARRHGTLYVAFVDPSGGSADSMTLAIGHKERNGKPTVDLIREARPPFSPDNVVKDFAADLKRYRITKVTGDRYAGEWPRERFMAGLGDDGRPHGIVYDVADDPKSTIYQGLLPLLNSAGCQLLDNPRLIAQICGLERRTARGGRDSIDHGPGAHDDVANAVAGVLTLLAGKGQMVQVSNDALAFLAQRG